MEITKFLSVLKDTQSGSQFVIEWARNLKLKNGEMITKKCIGSFILGLKYKDTIDPSQLKDPSQLQPVNWLLQDYVKVSTKGNNLLLVYPSNAEKTKVEYNDSLGNVVDLNNIIANMYANDKPKPNKNLNMFTINVNDIIRIEC